jgi:putative membrane protein
MLVRNIFIVLVASLHVYFLILEMFLWTKPLGMKTFKMSQQKAADSAVLAANQGLYNGFLAAGLLWSLFNPNIDISRQLATFFLSCIVIAALYGAYSVNRRILLIQGVPAIITLVLNLLVTR